MSLRSLLTMATLAFLVNQAAASCQLKNVLDSTDLPSVHSELCQPRDDGDYTFSMDVSELDVPTFSSGAPWAGLVGSQSFLMYDEKCTLKGIYSPHQTNDCGGPYVIEENFLKYVLTVTSVNFDTADPYFSFKYANGKFSIRNNDCKCDEIGGGLSVEQGCKCNFPVEGLPDKRRSVEVSFKA